MLRTLALSLAALALALAAATAPPKDTDTAAACACSTDTGQADTCAGVDLPNLAIVSRAAVELQHLQALQATPSPYAELQAGQVANAGTNGKPWPCEYAELLRAQAAPMPSSTVAQELQGMSSSRHRGKLQGLIIGKTHRSAILHC